MWNIALNDLKRSLLLGLTTASVLLAAGCAGSGSGNNSGSTQVPPAGSQGTKSYTYAGTQSVDSRLTFFYGGAWTSNLDDTNNYFSYENVGHVGGQIETGPNSLVNLPYPVPVTGGVSGSGFRSLTPAAAGSPAGIGGYAVELPGEGLLLRPDTQTMDEFIPNLNDQHPSTPMVAPVVAAASSTCPSLKGNVTYQFIALGSQWAASGDLLEHAVYGSVQISGAGTAFTFSNFSTYGFSADSLSPAALPAGNCGTTESGYVISSTATEQYWLDVLPEKGPYTSSYPLTTSLSPSGLFVMDQGQGAPYQGPNSAAILPGASSLLGLAGVQQPSSPLDTGSIVGGKYLGFEFDAVDVGLNRPASNPVSFGQAAGSGTVMTGGGYANDDVTQTPTTNIAIDLGQQDSANNGLYKNVKVTVPDTFNGCAGQRFGGTDAQGNPTCIFPGVAVAGSVGGKFVLFLSANDLSQAAAGYSKYATLQFFLYQQ